MPRFAKTQGIILRKYDFSETSHVLSLFTRDYGRVQVLAKGSRRVHRKRLTGFLDLLSRADVVFIPKPGDALSTLTEHEVVEDYRGIRADLSKLGSAFLTAEILDLASQELQSHPELYELETTILERLDRAPPAAVPALMLGFELRFLRRIGFGMELDQCVASGRPREQCASTWFSPALGGLIDGSQRAADPRAFSVSPGLLAILRSLGQGSWDAAERSRVPTGRYREARRLLVRNYQHLFERRLRAPAFLDNVTDGPRRPSQRAVEGSRTHR